jgi:shikimate 5-dehydrogenase
VRKQKKYKNLKFFNPISNIKKLVYSKKKNEREFVNKNLRIINKNLIETYKFLSQNSNASVFDIIYNPSLTQLINHAKTYGMRTIYGLEMNLYQAIKAFKIVNNIQNENKIRIAMIKNG